MIVLTPKQQMAMDAIASEKYSFILYGGAMAGGKTFWGLSSLLIMCEIFKGSRWVVVRQDMEKIRTTTIPSFKKLNYSGTLLQSPFHYIHPNGSEILFKGENFDGDKDLQWLKGLEASGFLFEEINEIQQSTFNLSFSRAGRWESTPRPKPIVLATCNPTTNWVKTEIFDRWRDNVLPDKWTYIPARLTDNPHLTEDYIENTKNLPPVQYARFIEGDWDVLDEVHNAFLYEWRDDKHVDDSIELNKNLPVYISVDFNINPLCALVIQFDKMKTKVIEEIKIEKGSVEAFCDYVESTGIPSGLIRICGDAMGRGGTVQQRDNSSAYIQIARRLRLAPNQIIVPGNPTHSNSRIDCNTALRRMDIKVNSKTCKGFIIDAKQVQCDADGGIIKTNRKKLTERADFLDCFRYFVNAILKRHL